MAKSLGVGVGMGMDQISKIDGILSGTGFNLPLCRKHLEVSHS